MHLSLQKSTILASIFLSGLLFSCQTTPAETEDLITNPALLLSDADLPDYELQLDHEGLMADWTPEFYHKGRITYRNVCFNCHGKHRDKNQLFQTPFRIENELR